MVQPNREPKIGHLDEEELRAALAACNIDPGSASEAVATGALAPDNTIDIGVAMHAVMHGRHAWPLCMAVAYVAMHVVIHGRHAWPPCMAVMHGRHAWPLCMAAMHGR